MTPDQIKFALGLALAGLIFASGMMVENWRQDSVAMAIRQVKDEVSLANAESIATIKIENKTVYAKTVEKVTKETMYRECQQDDAMLTLTNQALMGK